MSSYNICCNEKGFWEVWRYDELVRGGFETEEEAWEFVDLLEA